MDIPKEQLRYLVGKFHAGKSDDYVRTEVRKRTTGRSGWTQSLIRKAEEYAVKIHHDNQGLYDYVMGGTRRTGNPPNRIWVVVERGVGHVSAAKIAVSASSREAAMRKAKQAIPFLGVGSALRARPETLAERRHRESGGYVWKIE